MRYHNERERSPAAAIGEMERLVMPLADADNSLMLTGHKNGTASAADTRLEFYFQTREAWEAMYEDCRRAEKSIEFEQYIMRDGIGTRFLELFAEKARQGVAIHLLLDPVGSRMLVASPLVAEIRKHGGTVVFYNPLKWRNLFAPRTWFPRNHAKVMLIDSRIAYIGSVCLADYMHDWCDSHVRVTGALVGEIERDFAYIWGRAASRRRFSRRNGRNSVFRYDVNRPSLGPNPIYREMLDEIDKARESVFMATPYFLPPIRLLRALQRAVERGVDVRVLITEKTDVPLAVHVSRSYFSGLLRRGIRIFFHKKTVFHAKYVTVDERWAMIGSTNIDYLSLLRNREANIFIRDPETVRTLRERFEADLEDSEEIKTNFWKKVPLRSKIIGYAGRFMKKML